MTTLLKGATVVSGEGMEVMDVRIDGEKISEVGKNLSTADSKVVDLSGHIIFPGFIDAHTHLDMDTAVMHTADNFESGTKGAVVGGTTTVIDFATQNKGESLHEAMKNWHSLADGNSSCDYGFHMAITDWNDSVASEIDDMENLGVTSYKMYMAYDNLRLSDAEIFDALTKIHSVGGLASMHCENGDLINKLTMREKSLGNFGPSSHPKTHPSEIEAEAVTRYTCIAKMVGAPVYIVHVSSKEGLSAALCAKESGGEVYIESCPQYFLMDDSKYNLDGFESAKFVLSPPLRTKDDISSLWEQAGQEKIDVIATDHCSFNFDGQKDFGKDDFSKIPNGIPGVQHRVSLMYSYGVKTGKITLMQLVRMLSENPAKLFGLYPRKGVVAVGSDADIVVLDPSFRGKIHAEDMQMNVDYTPYEGMDTEGRIKQVYLRGEQVVEDGKIIKENSGIYLNRDRYTKV